MQVFAGLFVLLAALWLMGFAIWCLLRPLSASRFLEGFATTARAHYTEQVLRVLAGIALVLHAPYMRSPFFIYGFGWVLVATSTLLILLPWRWHQRFAQWAIPLAVRNLRSYALSSFALGALLAWALLTPLYVSSQ